MNIKIDELLKKEVSRKEFLGLIGAGLLSIVGISGLLKNLNIDLNKKTTSNLLDYGGDVYGGSSQKGPIGKF